MLKQRVITSLVLIPGFLAALFLSNHFVWSVLMFGIAMIALQEWAGLSKFNKNQLWAYLASSFVMIGALIFADYELSKAVDNTAAVAYVALACAVSAAFWLLIVPVWLYKQFQVKSKLLMAICGWLLILPLWGALVVQQLINPWMLLGLMALVWIADSAAYFAGKRFGKHKLAPAISPGKTWEGVLGAFVAVNVYAVLVSMYAHLNTLYILLAASLLLALSILGDLFESMIKRQAGAKDSGQLLPGHGGVLDRIDGLTSTLPVAMLLIFLINFI